MSSPYACRRRLTAAVAAVLLLSLGAALAQTPTPAATPAARPAAGPAPGAFPAVVAIVNGKPLTVQAFDQAARDGFAAKILDTLIRRRLIFDAAAKAGVAVTAQELQAKAAADYKQPPAVVARTLGVTEEYFWLQIKTDLLLEKLVGRHGRISADEIVGYYEKHKADFVRPARVHLWELATTDIEAAYTARRRVSGGETFGSVAREMSVAASAAQDGDLGWLAAPQIGDELTRATAFSLEPGQVSNPLAVEGKYYLLYVSEAETERSLSLVQAREDIVTALRQDKGITPDSVLETLLREASVQINWPPAAGLAEQYRRLRDIQIVVDDKRLELPVAPRLEGGKLVAPVKALAEALGAKVTWNAENSTLTATRGERTVALTVVLTEGQLTALVNGQRVPVSYARLTEGVFLSEARVLIEGLGGTLKWEAARNTLVVKSAAPLGLTP